MMGYLFLALPVVLLAGSATAAAVGRSFRAGLWACAWAVVLAMPPLVAAWLAEALAWHQQRGQLLLDADGALGVGVNLGDAVWWTLMLLALWVLPFGVIGAAAASARPRRRRWPASRSSRPASSGPARPCPRAGREAPAWP